MASASAEAAWAFLPGVVRSSSSCKCCVALRSVSVEGAWCSIDSYVRIGVALGAGHASGKFGVVAFDIGPRARPYRGSLCAHSSENPLSSSISMTSGTVISLRQGGDGDERVEEKAASGWRRGGRRMMARR